ncbi:MAG: metallophosphoesterase [gamma proteobacterium symbiont of Taylorina sp.]|nr:metallophosphoesterase [gamma proteobacterium symbiont of Taylorina sp.]
MKYKNFDIIGDIHGHADALVRLLKKMGYKKHNGIYSHSKRQVVFLGDFIDRGNEQKNVIDIVKPMVDNGYALAIMGNHEFNAICYHTYGDDKKPLREHSKKNQEQHYEFLKAYPLGDDKTKYVIDWFKTLPLFLDNKFEDFRAIHACWNEAAIKTIQPYLESDNTISEEFIKKSSQKGTIEYNAIEVLLKGLEIKLPDGNSFKDKDGHIRHKIRVKWWLNDAETYYDYALVHKAAMTSISKEKLLKDKIIPAYSGTKAVFFGHYWFTDKPRILTEKIVCLDYSIANKEKLVCYRWNNNEKELSDNNFEMVTAE